MSLAAASITYTYKCYDQTRTGTIAARLKNGLGIENVCRSPLVQDWKMRVSINWYNAESFSNPIPPSVVS